MPHLNTYLNDHLAGATGALELLGHLIDHADEPEFEAFCRRLRTEIESDVSELRGFMQRLGVAENSVKKLVARLAEKAADLKLLLAGEQPAGLGRLQALEILYVGIVGKRALWAALAAARHPTWPAIDLTRLIERAEAQ